MNLSFEDIYETYYARVFQAAISVTKDHGIAEDVLQEAFLKAYQKLHRIEDNKKVQAWLVTITKRTAIDFLRKEKKVTLLPIEEEILPFEKRAESSTVEKQLEVNDLNEGIKTKVNTLSPKLKKVFQLKYYNELQEKEIASKLQLSDSCVKSRLYRARHVMKEKVLEVVGDQTA
ncbi:RNA polymerase sigma factor [Halobacillus salinarum]|uniref:RNA polymerase sigma factor n=1 Tax=Halobacillus salinarum TaxID=2932257 RepID=A0ABY4EJ94_9BACI|nr:RNA polymerase sigma factor [Halobacillus salinarum]UOQ44505.1 RNA polymerase sigma factor [Halobacillus salinarum]